MKNQMTLTGMAIWGYLVVILLNILFWHFIAKFW